MWEQRWLKANFRKIALDLFDMISFLVFVLGIVLFVRFFVANPYTVVWESMSPTFHENDFIIVDKLSQRFWDLHRWDVIVFVPDGKSVPFIKRVIWFPWETVKIKKWHVWICDESGNACEVLDEPYIPEWVQTKTKCGITEFKIKEGVFVMWDNRWFSTDSLCCFGLGCYDWATYEVTSDDIIWKVLFRVFPNIWTDFYG